MQAHAVLRLGGFGFCLYNALRLFFFVVFFSPGKQAKEFMAGREGLTFYSAVKLFSFVCLTSEVNCA